MGKRWSSQKLSSLASRGQGQGSLVWGVLAATLVLSFGCAAPQQGGLSKGSLSTREEIRDFWTLPYNESFLHTPLPEEQIQAIQLRAEEGEPTAQYTWAWMHQYGYQVTKDESTARTWYALAAEQDVTEAHLGLGYLWESGLGGSRNDEEALQHYVKAAEKGHGRALYNIGRLLDLQRINLGQIDPRLQRQLLKESLRAKPQEGAAFPTTTSREGQLGLSWHIAAIRKEVPEGFLALAAKAETGSEMSASPVAAALLYKEAAQQGDALASRRLSLMYDLGRYVPQDRAQATQLSRLPAQKGDPLARSRLALGFLGGLGVQVDPQEALRLYQQDADHYAPSAFGLAYTMVQQRQQLDEVVDLYTRAGQAGYAEAWTNLAYLHQNNNLPNADATEALRLYRQAEKLGSTQALFNLSIMYYTGQGVVANTEEALRLLQEAAERGNVFAQYNLGLLHVQGGWGLDENLPEGVFWIGLAGERNQGLWKARMERSWKLSVNQLPQEIRTEIRERILAWTPRG